jgi:hypothetical protein
MKSGKGVSRKTSEVSESNTKEGSENQISDTVSVDNTLRSTETITRGRDVSLWAGTQPNGCLKLRRGNGLRFLC